MGYSPWGHKESDTTERLNFHFSLSCIGEGMTTHSSVLAWRIPAMGSHGNAVYGVAWSRTAQKVTQPIFPPWPLEGARLTLMVAQKKAGVATS